MVRPPVDICRGTRPSQAAKQMKDDGSYQKIIDDFFSQ
jgi:hypothetical protein